MSSVRGRQSQPAAAAVAPGARPGKPGAATNYEKEHRERGKSKRAVLKDGGIVRSREAREVAGGVTVKEWQRLPRQLLHEYCQREKRPRPFYPKAQCPVDGKHRVRCIVGDPKGNKAKELMFCANECFDTVAESEEWTSMLALKHLTPSLPLEQKLPSPYREGWLSLTTSSPAVTNERAHVSVAEVVAKKEINRQRANQIEARKEARIRNIPQVFMSEDNRHFIEQILKSASKFNQENRDGHGVSDNESEQKRASPVSSEASAKATNKLASLGFDRADIARALSSVATVDYDTLLNWLLIHLPEASLPARFDPRGTQFEVVNSATKSGSYWQSMYSVPAKLIKKISDECDGDEERVASKICSIIYASITSADASSNTDTESDSDSVSEELVALESIFGSDCIVINNHRVSVKISRTLTVEYWASSHSHYPAQLPIILIHHLSLSAIDRLQLLLSLVSHAHGEGMIGKPCLYDLCAHLQSHGDEMIASARQLPISEPQEFVEHSNLLTAEQRAAIHSQTQDRVSDERDDGHRNPSDHPVAVPTQPNKPLSANIRANLDSRRKQSNYQKILQTRKALPMFNSASTAIQALESHRAILVTAATGAGKSTQFPSLLLDHYIDSDRGSEVNIVCTQPRRISAIGLASRVAEERGESLGQSVGYRIKNESKMSGDTRLSFVTGGILLRQVTNNPQSLLNYSHILVDEVHERSTEIDTLLFILKRAISQPGSKLRIVLMSATVAADRIIAYFNDCPAFDTPGRAFPVTVSHLEDMLELTKFVPCHRYRLKGIKAEELSQRVSALSSALNVRGRQRYSEPVLNILATLNIAELDCDLVSATVVHAIEMHAEGAILTFLPSVESINQCINITKQMIRDRGWRESDFWVMPLHASLPPAEQSAVFKRPPSYVRKLIFSTNVAETSITIDDITVVVDSGRMKSMQFDPAKSMSSLIESWVAQSNAIQRTGRAGRVQAGHCYRCYTSQHYQTFSKQQIPELHRVPLDQLCLSLPIYAAVNGREDGNDRTPSQFFTTTLSEFLDPPPLTAIDSALFSLHRLGAIRADNYRSKKPISFLTALGRHLAVMPVTSARIGRMLLMAAAFDCVSPVTIIAAFLIDRDPFMKPSVNDRQAFNEARIQFVHPRSDHLTWVKAYDSWLRVKLQSGEGAAKRFAHENFLHHLTLLAVDKQRHQFRGSLAQCGFLTSHYDKNSGDASIVLAAVCAGLYPSILRVKFPAISYQQTAHGAVPKPFKPNEIKYMIQQNAVISARLQASATADAVASNDSEEEDLTSETSTVASCESDVSNAATTVKDDDSDSETETSASAQSQSQSLLVSPRVSSRVFLHPRSVNFHSIAYDSPHLVYHELVQTSKQFVVDSSMVPAYSLLLFGGALSFDSDAGIVRIDDWLEFRAAPRICALVVELRGCIERLMELKLARGKRVNISESPIIEAALRLVRSSGF